MVWYRKKEKGQLGVKLMGAGGVTGNKVKGSSREREKLRGNLQGENFFWERHSAGINHQTIA